MGMAIGTVRMLTHLVKRGKANPKGIASHSPRLPYSATLGGRLVMRPYPNGVAPLWPRMLNNEDCVTCYGKPQPLSGLSPYDQCDLGTAPSPRVAEYVNPGLRDATPSGLHSLLYE